MFSSLKRLSCSHVNLKQKHKFLSISNISFVNFSSVTQIRFDLTSDEILNISSQLQDVTTKTYDSIANLNNNQLTANNVLLPLINLSQQNNGLLHNMFFLKNVSPLKEIRDASITVSQELSKYFIDISMRKDVFNIVKKYNNNCQNEIKTLPNEWKRLLEHMLRDYRRSGLELDDISYDKMKQLSKEISILQIQFQQNMNEENTYFYFDKEELDGLDNDYLNSRYDNDKQKYKVTLQYPCYIPVMQKCNDDNTRKILEKAFNSRCKDENSKIIERLVELRHEKAQLLNLDSHNDFVLETRMAKNPETVSEFLNSLNDKMTSLAEKDMKKLLELKKNRFKSLNKLNEFDNLIHPYEYSYYTEIRKKNECNLDNELVKQYFPVQIVIKGCLEIYSELLSLKFNEINKDEQRVFSSNLWDSDVQLFEVIDTSSNNENDKKVMGYILLDLYPRDGKFGHACMAALQGGCSIYDDNGNIIGKQLPINTMICNFAKPTEETPSLLTHNDVVTFFHEFGHAMHQICGQPNLCEFSGTNVEQDFVETPSQMFENWCWYSQSLKRMSGHFNNTNEQLPDKLIESLKQSKDLGIGLFTKRQLSFSLLDQYIHSLSKIDSEKVSKEYLSSIWGIIPSKDTNFLATFLHLGGGYDSSYYGYLWAEVYCMDIFMSKFGENNLFNKEIGLKYRNEVLSKGGSIDGREMLKHFLGREPTLEAFLKAKGAQV